MPVRAPQEQNYHLFFVPLADSQLGTCRRAQTAQQGLLVAAFLLTKLMLAKVAPTRQVPLLSAQYALLETNVRTQPALDRRVLPAASAKEVYRLVRYVRLEVHARRGAVFPSLVPQADTARLETLRVLLAMQVSSAHNNRHQRGHSVTNVLWEDGVQRLPHQLPIVFLDSMAPL